MLGKLRQHVLRGLGFGCPAQWPRGPGYALRGGLQIQSSRRPPGAPPVAGANHPEPSAGNPGSADKTGMMTSVHTVIDTTFPM